LDCDENIREKLREAAESVRQRAALKNYKNVSYASVVRTGYEEIQKLREEGYTYNVICEAFVERGILKESATPKGLSTIFQRETKRRAKLSERSGNGGSRENNQGKKASIITKNEEAGLKNAKKKEPEETREDDVTERLKQLTGTVVDTGTGKIRKMPGGTFEF
jgi:hypothetical protein